MTNLASRRLSYLSFVLPAFIVFISIMVFPVFYSFALSFTEWKGYGPKIWVGLGNFIRMFNDEVFLIGLRNNILIVLLSVFGQIPLGLLLAYMLHRKMVRGGNLFQMLIFLPITISSVIVAQLWNRVFAPVGILPAIVRAVTGNNDYIMTIFEDKIYAVVPIMFVLLWQHTSLYMVIFLANLQRIPNSVVEAAKLEGASEGHIFRRIIVPMQMPVVFINSILAIAGSFKSFDLIFAMTGGGPAHYTEVIAVYMFNTTFVYQNYGYGSALAVVIILFSVITILMTQIFRKRFSYE